MRLGTCQVGRKRHPQEGRHALRQAGDVPCSWEAPSTRRGTHATRARPGQAHSTRLDSGRILRGKASPPAFQNLGKPSDHDLDLGREERGGGAVALDNAAVDEEELEEELDEEAVWDSGESRRTTDNVNASSSIHLAGTNWTKPCHGCTSSPVTTGWQLSQPCLTLDSSRAVHPARPPRSQ